MFTYHQLDQRIHQLAQTIAKFNRTYVLKKEDDSHTNLAFEVSSKRLLGRWAESSKGKIIMALSLRGFSFEILDEDHQPLFTVDINGKTQVELEQIIESFLPQLGLPTAGFTAPMHYEIPNYNFAQDAFSKWPATDLTIWADHRVLANTSCQQLLDHLQLTADIRIWPHHFDTGTYVEPSYKIGLGFGLAQQDEMVGSPYYYFSAYGLNGHQIDFNALPDLSHGSWLVNDSFKGAVLSLAEADSETVSAFLLEVAGRYLGRGY